MCAVAVVQKDLAVVTEDLFDPVDRRVWEVVEGELAENGVFLRASKFCRHQLATARPYALPATRIGEVLDMTCRRR